MRPHTRTQCQVGGNCQECIPPSLTTSHGHHHNNSGDGHSSSQTAQHGHSGYAAHLHAGNGHASAVATSHATSSLASHSGNVGVAGSSAASSSNGSVNVVGKAESHAGSANGAHHHHHTSSESGSGIATNGTAASGNRSGLHGESGGSAHDRRDSSGTDNNVFVVPTQATMTRSRSSIHMRQQMQQQAADHGASVTSVSGGRNGGMALRSNPRNAPESHAPRASVVSRQSSSASSLTLHRIQHTEVSSPSPNPPPVASSASENSASAVANVLPATPRSMLLVELPAEVLVKILTYLSFAEIAQLRIVSRRFNEICASILNATFHKLQAHILQRFQDIKQSMPRRESARRNHPLAVECDIVETLHMRLTLLQMTFGKHIERKHICFFAGEILDETYRIMHHVRTAANLGRSFKVTDELVDLSTMAMEYFKDKIECTLPDITCFGAEYLNFTTPYSSSSLTPSKRRSGSASSVSSSCSSAETWSHVRLGGSASGGAGGRGGGGNNTSVFALGGSGSSVNTPMRNQMHRTAMANVAAASSSPAVYGLGSSGGPGRGTPAVRNSGDIMGASSSHAGCCGSGSGCMASGGSSGHPGMLDDEDDVMIYEDDDNEDMLSATEMLRGEIRKIRQDMKKSSVASLGLKKQLKALKSKVESQSKQFSSFAQRLDSYDKKMDDSARKFQSMLTELNKCRTELQFWRSRCLTSGGESTLHELMSIEQQAAAAAAMGAANGEAVAVREPMAAVGAAAAPPAVPAVASNSRSTAHTHALRHSARRESAEHAAAAAAAAGPLQNDGQPSIGVSLRARKNSGDVSNAATHHPLHHSVSGESSSTASGTSSAANDSATIGTSSASSIRPLKRGSLGGASEDHGSAANGNEPLSLLRSGSKRPKNNGGSGNSGGDGSTGGGGGAGANNGSVVTRQSMFNGTNNVHGSGD